MNYVDGFVIPVPKKKVSAYRSMAKLCAKVWLEHGAKHTAQWWGRITSPIRSVKWMCV